MNDFFKAGSLILCCFTCAPVWSANLIYKVVKDSQNTGHIEINTAALGKFQLQPSRMQFSASDKGMPPLLCHQGSSSFEVACQEDIECERVSWPLVFNEIPVTGIDASLQKNYVSQAGWHLLTEWGNFPRIANQPDALVCPPGKEACTPLAHLNEPPSFISWGIKPGRITIGSASLKLYTLQDFPGQTQTLLTEQLHYLSQVFGKGITPDNWTLIWLPKEISSGSLGGAAGNQIFMANYPVKDGALVADSLPRLLRISCHESIHILSRQKNPVWVSESIAEYYAWKALKTSHTPSVSPLESYQNSKHPLLATGLYAANHQVSDLKQMSYYALFYIKGAAFWQELDQALVRHGRSLDSYLPDAGNDNAALPAGFTQTIVSVIGKAEWLSLEKKYLL